MLRSLRPKIAGAVVETTNAAPGAIAEHLQKAALRALRHLRLVMSVVLDDFVLRGIPIREGPVEPVAKGEGVAGGPAHDGNHSEGETAPRISRDLGGIGKETSAQGPLSRPVRQRSGSITIERGG